MRMIALGTVALMACTSNGTNPADAAATCPSPGEATPGSADTHCAAKVQPTSAASCHPDAGPDDGGAPSCPYGGTIHGQESDDDDCKYHVTWTSSPICEGTGGVQFTLVVTNKGDGTPLTGAATYAESFTTSPATDAGCDNQSNHPGPNSGVALTEGPPGTYGGRVGFDKAGQWTLRFHFHGECADLKPDSPHGHAAYYITVP